MPNSDSNAPNPPIKIGILLIDGFALMSYAGIIEPMRAANLLRETPLYAVEHFSLGGQMALSSSGAMIKTSDLLAIDPSTLTLDRLFVIAGGDPFEAQNVPLLSWLRRAGRTGTAIVGVSGGPVLLALAGLLDGHRMTVHWEHAARLADDNHNLQIKRTLFVIDRNRITCAGGTAPMDLMNVLIAKDTSEGFAREVSDWFLHTEIRPPVGPQKSGLIERYATHNRSVLLAIEAMESHIADPLSQEQLAQFVGISTRQLCRLFLQEFSVAPMSFYRDLRLDHAARFLKQTSMSITEIAFATGFSSASHFSTKFADKFQKSPREYQRQTRRAP